MMNAHWRKCSSCRKPIAFSQDYWSCNVSTCNRNRTFFTFCSVSCWDAHLGLVRHKESWAEEKRAPTFEEWEKAKVNEIWPPREKKAKAVIEAKPLASLERKVILRRKT